MGMLDTLRELKRDIADYRDYQIAHEKGARTMRGTLINPGTRPSMTMSSRNGRQSGDIDALMVLIEKYISQVIDLTVTNRAKSRYSAA